MSSFVTGFQKFACIHPQMTPEDGKGYAICTRCGGVMAVRLTPTMLERAFEQMANR